MGEVKGKAVIGMKIRRLIRLSGLLLLLGFAPASLAQSLPPGVTPSMVQQFQNMSPSQQQALAKQYGVTVPDAPAQKAEQASGLGDAGEQLDQTDPSTAEEDDDELAEDTSSAATQGLRRYAAHFLIARFRPSHPLTMHRFLMNIGWEWAIS